MKHIKYTTKEEFHNDCSIMAIFIDIEYPSYIPKWTYPETHNIFDQDLGESTFREEVEKFVQDIDRKVGLYKLLAEHQSEINTGYTSESVTGITEESFEYLIETLIEKAGL